MRAEDKDVVGKVQSIVPLPEPYLILRDLAAPFAAAWVVLSNTQGELEPGLRLRPTTVPASPIAVVSRRALKKDTARGSDASLVQVLRNQFVSNIPIQVIGEVGPDRVQIAGPFFESDTLIVASSVTLLPGTLVPSTSRGRTAAGTDLTPSGSSRHAAAPNQPARPAGRPVGDSSTPY